MTIKTDKDKFFISLPEPVKMIIKTLQQAGFEAYAVGGCVRDSVLGRVPDDWDITTSAKPLQVKELFCRTVDTGIKHGTVTVMYGKEGFEVTTYRVDGEYEDGRHPKKVTFTASLEEDLKRRDFTINAMAYNETDGLVDIFDGIGDIKRKVIRCVGNAQERFNEDALRMMRAVRFSAQLGYDIEEKTKAAICALAENLCKISAERVQIELLKLVVSPHPDYLRIAYETGITAVVFPEFDKMMETEQRNPHHCYSVGEHTLCSMRNVPPDKVLRLTMLFHDIGKPDVAFRDENGKDHFHGHPEKSREIALKVLRRLKFDNDTIEKVCTLCRYHDYKIMPEESSMRRAMNRIGTGSFPAIFQVKRADALAQSDYLRREKMEELDELEKIYRRVIDEKQCVVLKDLAISGKDLIAAGMKPGKKLGEVLGMLLEEVLSDPEKNNREYLLKQADAYRQGT